MPSPAGLTPRRGPGGALAWLHVGPLPLCLWLLPHGGMGTRAVELNVHKVNPSGLSAAQPQWLPCGWALRPRIPYLNSLSEPLKKRGSGTPLSR